LEKSLAAVAVVVKISENRRKIRARGQIGAKNRHEVHQFLVTSSFVHH
jgi:hypothetical protein